MNWIRVKDKLPTFDTQYVTFVQWIQLKEPLCFPVIIESFAGTWGEVQAWREYQLKNTYTHWKSIGRPPK